MFLTFLRWLGLQTARLRFPRRLLGGVRRLGWCSALGELPGNGHRGGPAVLQEVQRDEEEKKEKKEEEMRRRDKVVKF